MLKAKPDGVTALAWMLGGYGLFTVCLAFAAYRSIGSEAALLTMAGAASIAAPLGGLITLLIFSWQISPSGRGGRGEADISPAAPGVPPHGAVFVVGNGSEAVSVRVGAGGVSIVTGSTAASGASDVRRSGDGDAPGPLIVSG